MKIPLWCDIPWLVAVAAAWDNAISLVHWLEHDVKKFNVCHDGRLSFVPPIDDVSFSLMEMKNHADILQAWVWALMLPSIIFSWGTAALQAVLQPNGLLLLALILVGFFISVAVLRNRAYREQLRLITTAEVMSS